MKGEGRSEKEGRKLVAIASRYPDGAESIAASLRSMPKACVSKGTVLLVAAPLLVASVSAQEIELSGYYENTFQVDYTSETKGQFLDASKVRFEWGGMLLPDLEFAGNVNLILSVGETERRLSPYLPDAVGQQLEALGMPDTFSLDEARLFLDNAYLTWDNGDVRLRAGKQQLSWGSGYSFNPTDLFHRKNLLDPTYEKEGVVAFRTDYRWGTGGELSLIGATDERFDHPGYALRLGTHVSAVRYDLAVTLHDVSDSTGMDPLTFMPYTQRRRAGGLEISGELLGLGVWLEGNYNWVGREDDFARLVAGFDYTLDDGTYLMAEALYNGRSESDTPYPAHDWLANVYHGEPVGPGWMLLGARRDLSALVQGGFYTFVAPDGSVVLNPRIDASLFQNIDLVFFGGVSLGNNDGAFTSGLYSVIVRGTGYF